MKRRSTPHILIGAAALLALGSSIAFAQDSSKAKPRSTRRIPISKEAPGEVAGATTATKTDTVTVYRTDTLRVTTTTPPRVDTVRTTNTVTRVDTVTVAPPMKPVILPGGLYVGVGGGVSAPNGALYQPNAAGPTAQLQLGWQGKSNPLGLRVDGNWTKPGPDAFYSQFQGDPSIVNVNGDLKLDLPVFNHAFGITPRFKLYALGGASYIMYKNLPIRSTLAGAGVGPVNVLAGDPDWQKHWGWNAGGGASIGFGRTEVFAETRVIAWTTDITPQSRQMPFVLGINLF